MSAERTADSDPERRGPKVIDRPSWHAVTLQEVLDRLEASAAGLSSDQAAERLRRFGFNRLPEQPPTTRWQILARQFASPLIYILMLAAVAAMLLGDWKDAGFITAVLVFNALVGSYQEWKAEQSSQALRKLLKIRATVRRDGSDHEIAAEEVVPGDRVLLESGNRVSADTRLIGAHSLEVDESLLTGESLPVAKQVDWQAEDDVPLGDRRNMLFAGSTIAKGRASGIVVATGADTEVGQLALDMTSATGGRPPLLQRMERFTNRIAFGVLAIATAIGTLGVTLGGYSIGEMFVLAVALAVSAIPEGLPVAMTIALAIATTRMARRGVIVRRLTAVEGLGSCTLVATDKTGTLTVNELTVRELHLPDHRVCGANGHGFAPDGQLEIDGVTIDATTPAAADPLLFDLLQAGVLCNEASLNRRGDHWEWRGDAVDVALLTVAEKAGCTQESIRGRFRNLGEIPFESERQYAATLHTASDATSDSPRRMFVKGAPERVLEMCERATTRATFEPIAESMAARGLRVLALAEGQIDHHEGESVLERDPEGLRFLGLVGMIDPLRPGARDAVDACHQAGVRVAMVTGDHAVTALAIARELGLADDDSQVLTGDQLSHLSDEEKPARIAATQVFARVAPRQKLEIVQAARLAHEFVAVTGDGVNDAPALRAANIGVAMGKSGTDVAREAAELVISDDNFSTIVAGIEEGRVAYDNIRKVIVLLISTGAAELILMALAVSFQTPLPLLPVQILWLNLVTNGIQDIALAFEKADGDVLRRSPRPPQEPIFNRLMIERVLVAAVVMGIVGFAAFYWMIDRGWETSAARNVILLMMVLFENFHIGNCRSETRSAFSLSPLRSPLLLFGALTALLLHLLVMHWSWMQTILDTSPVSLEVFAVVALFAVTIVPAVELHKWVWMRRHRGDPKV